MSVDVKKVSQLGGVGTNNTSGIPKSQPLKGGPSFAETLNRTQGLVEGAQGSKINPAGVGSLDPVKFSNHAVERMMSRGIKFSPEDMGRLNEAVAKASAKGSKDTLVLMNDSALIVSVKNKTVVTVMDKTALKENVFTNIDSTIVM